MVVSRMYAKRVFCSMSFCLFALNSWATLAIALIPPVRSPPIPPPRSPPAAPPAPPPPPPPPSREPAPPPAPPPPPNNLPSPPLSFVSLPRMMSMPLVTIADNEALAKRLEYAGHLFGEAAALQYDVGECLGGVGKQRPHGGGPDALHLPGLFGYFFGHLGDRGIVSEVQTFHLVPEIPHVSGHVFDDALWHGPKAVGGHAG